jgi:hypothetical protein
VYLPGEVPHMTVGLGGLSLVVQVTRIWPEALVTASRACVGRFDCLQHTVDG